MLTPNNFANALEVIGFTDKNGIYEKYFPAFGITLKADLINRELLYPVEIKGRERNDYYDDTHKENLVVFECVHRLLEKGYRPEHIELEKEWHLGSPKGIIHSDVLRIRVDTEVCNPVFLMCQLHFSRAIGTQIDTVSSGAIMAGINVTKLKKIMVYVPPIAIQNQFADFVALTDKSKLEAQNQKGKLFLQREQLITKYFR